MSSNKICVIAANNSITEDNKVIDYIQLASIAAERVKYFLGLPTVIITDDVEEVAKYPVFYGAINQKSITPSKRIMIAGDDTIQYNWYNDSRIDAFELTKHIGKRILMIDADYIIASDQLIHWINADYPFMIFNNVYDITGRKIYDNTKYLPSNDIVQRWATAICFDHSEESRLVFDTVRMVKENYTFYSLMTGMPSSPYRNDLAFSIACHLHNIPFNSQTLYNLPPDATLNLLPQNKNQWLAIYGTSGVIWNCDVHILNKMYAIEQLKMNELRLQNVSA